MFDDVPIFSKFIFIGTTKLVLRLRLERYYKIKVLEHFVASDEVC